MSDAKRITTHTLLEMKEAGERISMLTAYDYSMATILDDAGIDIILVGDSASNVIAGHETTLFTNHFGSNDLSCPICY
ncbi:MAG: 3-methyl-2-oxobutanoate hydroxymethyltransferase [Chitinophagales bacterium]